MNKLLLLPDIVQEALAVFVAAVRLGFDPETEIAFGLVERIPAVSVTRRGIRFHVRIHGELHQQRWEYILRSWKENAKSLITEDVFSELDISSFYERSRFRERASLAFVKNLWKEGLLNINDIARTEKRIDAQKQG